MQRVDGQYVLHMTRVLYDAEQVASTFAAHVAEWSRFNDSTLVELEGVQVRHIGWGAVGSRFGMLLLVDAWRDELVAFCVGQPGNVCIAAEPSLRSGRFLGGCRHHGVGALL